MRLQEKILAKIRHIRQQPENVRLRWVWGAVIVSMFFVIAVWIFSLGTLFGRENNPNEVTASSVPDISGQLQDIKQQIPPIKDFFDKTSGSDTVDSEAEGRAKPAPAENTRGNSRSNNYSDLQSDGLSQ